MSFIPSPSSSLQKQGVGTNDLSPTAGHQKIP
jgi:hypothetical protein